MRLTLLRSAIRAFNLTKLKAFWNQEFLEGKDYTRIDHIAPDTRLVKICWIILVIFSFVGSLSKQYTQSGDIYQFAQMGECQVILVIDGSFWWKNNSGDISHFTKSVRKSNRIHQISENLSVQSGDILYNFISVRLVVTFTWSVIICW